MPIKPIDIGSSHDGMIAWLADEHTMRGAISDEPQHPSFSDRYVGWWANPAATDGMDVPTIAYVDGSYRIWDGWHHCIIVALHEQPTIPVLVGILSPVLVGISPGPYQRPRP